MELGVEEKLIKRINPWRKIFSYLCIGMMLTFFQINFFQLEIILPTIGEFFWFMSMRSLSAENKYFKKAYVASSIILLLQILGILLGIRGIWTNINQILGIFNAVLTIWLLICVRNGFKKILLKNQDRKFLGIFTGFIWIYAIILFVSLFVEGDVTLLVIPIIIVYIYLLISMRELGRYLQRSGYGLQLRVLKYSNGLVGCAYFGTVILVVLLSSLIRNVAIVDGEEMSPFKVDTHIEEKLLELGFPEDVLTMLPEKTTLLFENPVALKKTIGYYGDTDWRGKEITPMETKSILVELANGERYLVSIIHLVDVAANWRDGFSLETYYKNTLSYVDGGLIYEKAGKNYRDDIRVYNDGMSTYNATEMFLKNSQMVFEVTYHTGVKNQQVYVVNQVFMDDPELSFELEYNYYRMKQPFYLKDVNYQEIVERGMFPDMISGAYWE